MVIERGRGWLGSRLARVMVEDRTVSNGTITQKKISKGFKKIRIIKKGYKMKIR